MNNNELMLLQFLLIKMTLYTGNATASLLTSCFLELQYNLIVGVAYNDLL